MTKRGHARCSSDRGAICRIRDCHTQNRTASKKNCIESSNTRVRTNELPRECATVRQSHTMVDYRTTVSLSADCQRRTRIPSSLCQYRRQQNYRPNAFHIHEDMLLQQDGEMKAREELRIFI